MASRRSLLAACGTIATVGVTGCSALTDEPNAEIVHTLALRPETKDPVARIAAQEQDCPRGSVTLRAAAYEEDSGGMQVFSEVRVSPGAYECETDWSHDGIDMFHDWSRVAPNTDSGLTDTGSNVTHSGSQEARFTLENKSSAVTGKWIIRLVSEGTTPETYRFLTTFSRMDDDDGPNKLSAVIAEGDELATVRFDAPLSTGGVFGESATMNLDRTLTYGDVDAYNPRHSG